MKSNQYQDINSCLGKPAKKNWIFYDNLSKHDFFPKRNYDKRVGHNLLKNYSKPKVIIFTSIFMHMSSEHYCFVHLLSMNFNIIEFKVPVYPLFH